MARVGIRHAVFAGTAIAVAVGMAPPSDAASRPLTVFRKICLPYDHRSARPVIYPNGGGSLDLVTTQNHCGQNLYYLCSPAKDLFDYFDHNNFTFPPDGRCRPTNASVPQQVCPGCTG